MVADNAPVAKNLMIRNPRLCVENKELSLTESEIKLHAHNIYVAGQMWSFRRWILRKMFTLEEYIE